MVVEHKHALARPPGPLPGWKPRAKRFGERSTLQPARFVAFKAAFEIAEHEQEAAFPGDGLAGAERLGCLERRQRVVESPEIAQRQRFAAQRRREIGARGARAAISGQRLLHAVELQERVAEVDRRLGEVGTVRERALRRFEGILQATELAQRSGSAAPRVGVAGRQRGRRLEGRERLLEPAHVEQQLADVDVPYDDRRIELESLPIEA